MEALKLNAITLVVGATLGYALYKIIDKREQAQKSNFSSACGCGK